MIWIFILLVALGLTFVKIGAFSVWVKVLSLGLKLLTVFFFIFLGIFFWNKFQKKYPEKQGGSQSQLN